MNTFVYNSHHRGKNGGLDKYYTPKKIAVFFINQILEKCNDMGSIEWIEPSAGLGVFVDALRDKQPTANIRAMDICPSKNDIYKQDFFEYEHKKTTNTCIVYGNPPFGFKASLAIRFFNKAAEFADIIAFILPASFMKESVQNQLSLDFNKLYELKQDIIFDFPDGGSKKVPCVFQIWSRTDIKRSKIKNSNNNKLACEFVKTQQEANLAIRRVGAKAGKVLDMSKTLSPSSTFFIKCSKEIEYIIKNIDFTINVNNTAGVRSLSKNEFWELLNKAV